MISSKENSVKSDLEQYFDHFRENIVGINQTFQSPYGEQKLIYTDWITMSYEVHTQIQLSSRLWDSSWCSKKIKKQLEVGQCDFNNATTQISIA